MSASAARIVYSRRELLRLGAGAVAWASAATLAACAPPTPLRIAVQPFCGYQFLSLANEEGYLRGAGVELVPVATYTDAVKALVNDTADGAPVTLDQVLELRDRGMPLITVMVFDISAGADVVLARPGIDTLADLRDKRIGVEQTSLGTVMLAKLLDAAGLARRDVSIIPMDEDHFAAWQRGGMDAVLTYEPILSQLRALGLAPIFDSRSLPQTIVDILAVRATAASSHASALRALIAGHFRAQKLWRSNPIDTAYRLAGFLGVPAESVPGVINGLDLPDLVYNRHYLTPPAAELTHAAIDLGAILAREGMLRHPPQLAGLFVPDYLPGDDQ
jgi:NitT/TauT family transport system substrate-binding protein